MNTSSPFQADNLFEIVYKASDSVKTEEDLNLLISDFDADLLCSQMESLSVSQLVKFLRVSHNYYLSKKLPEIEQSLLHIREKYSNTHGLLAGLAVYFNNYKKKLVKHIRMEEEVFFPFIETLVLASEGRLSPEETKELLQATSLADFEDNHDSIEEELREVEQIIKAYASQTEQVLPFSVFLNQVTLFEYELRKHAVIEDMVLVKKVADLEAELRNV
ncbi:MAG: hemerythrin domain-containing protein [Cytophagales bacterium]|nr:hemerythrin domain-containing protein [Cytophagales bacterium]